MFPQLRHNMDPNSGSKVMFEPHVGHFTDSAESLPSPVFFCANPKGSDPAEFSGLEFHICFATPYFRAGSDHNEALTAYVRIISLASEGLHLKRRCKTDLNQDLHVPACSCHAACRNTCARQPSLSGLPESCISDYSAPDR